MTQRTWSPSKQVRRNKTGQLAVDLVQLDASGFARLEALGTGRESRINACGDDASRYGSWYGNIFAGLVGPGEAGTVHNQQVRAVLVAIVRPEHLSLVADTIAGSPLAGHFRSGMIGVVGAHDIDWQRRDGY